MNEYLKHPKVQKARRLLREAAQEIRSKKQMELRNDMCECSHKRKFHCPAHSVNYSDGACKKCDCLNFLQRR